MPVIAIAVYLDFMCFVETPPRVYQFIIVVMLACTLVFPLITIFLMKSSKVITSVHMPTKEERRWPLLFGILFFIMAYMIIKQVSSVNELNYITIAGISTLVVCYVVNLLYKLSIHMAAIGGITGMMVAYAPQADINMLYVIVGMIFVAGLIGFARLQLSAHNSGQVAAGYAAGFVSQYVMLSFLSSHILKSL